MVYIQAVTKEYVARVYHLVGSSRVETTEMLLTANEMDYNEETGEVEARGKVHFEDYNTGEKVDCDKAEYNINASTGNFYVITGSAPPQIKARPGLLTTTNPYYFEGRWAERLEGHYLLHDGFITDCVVPKPWWIFKAPVFDVVPNDHAIARNSVFYLRGVPIFYTPFFYKSLQKQPRRSGFLIPNIGNSSLHGKMVGFGYFWALNRSYDITYRGRYFSQAGLAHNLEIRGKVNQDTGFDLTVFGIKDTQQLEPSASGYRINMTGRSLLGKGWEARGDLDYLSSFAFVQNFTQSFNEAVYSETHSVGFATKHWSDYGVDIVAQRNVNFQSTTPGDTIGIRKLPEANFLVREHQISPETWPSWLAPVWLSLDSSAGLLDRSQPAFQTRQFVDRVDISPRVTTAFHWDFLSLTPSFGIRETAYGASFLNNQLTGGSFLRSSREASLDMVLPSVARVFKTPSWLKSLGMGDQVKHVIEPRVRYKYVTGVDDFAGIVRFDENDIIVNTNQVEFSLTNRLLAKDRNGTVSDVLTWQLRYARYFDPTFGGALVPGLRNAISSALDLSGFSFISGPRNYSPVVSVLRLQSKVGIEWRADYDPLRPGISNSSISIDGRINQYFWSLGHTDVRTVPPLAPAANQLRSRLGYGNPNRRGWNSGFDIYYDYLQGKMQYWQTQITRNTDCCGFSVQYRRFSVGTRNDSQVEVAFAISNIGTFGTLKKQERMF
jgi:LPS-assembly protein